MRTLTAALALSLASTQVDAHEMTPAYPELIPASVQGVMRADLFLFNARDDVEYYAISVWDADWNPIPFASAQRVMHIKPQSKQDFAVYIRKSDTDRAVYICTTSMLKAGQTDNAIVSSRICSRLDGERA
jgi:hypothetical protein